MFKINIDYDYADFYYLNFQNKIDDDGTDGKIFTTDYIGEGAVINEICLGVTIHNI